MGENVCCPHLRIIECGDTQEHQHFDCNPIITLSQGKHAKRLSENPLMDNDWVSVYCMNRDEKFTACKYYPKGE